MKILTNLNMMKIILQREFNLINQICLFSIFFLFTNDQLNSQVNQEWFNIYDGNLNNVSNGEELVADDFGNLYVAYFHEFDSVGTSDIVLIKYNSNNNREWISRYNGPGNGKDQVSGLEIDNSGNIYLIGESKGDGTGLDYVIIKYNPEGIEQWVNRFTSESDHTDAPYGITFDDSNNIYVTGQSSTGSELTYDCVTIKYDSSGNQIWLARHHDRQQQIGGKVITDKYGNVFVVGRGSEGLLTLKYNEAGIEQWVRYYRGPGGSNTGKRIGLDSLGNVYVSGTSEGEYYYDYVTLKYSPSGEELWVRRYNGTANYQDQLNDMVVEKSGNVYVTGNGTQTGAGYDYTTIKYNSNGDQLWITKYHNGLNDIALAMVQDDLGNIYVTGESDGNGTQFDYTTVKYDSSGNLKWSIRYNFSNQYRDKANDITLDKSNNVYITGGSFVWEEHGGIATTIKYSQTITGVTQVLMGKPDIYSLSQSYPNPFNPSSILGFGISKLGFVSLKVYDVLGNEVAALVNENKPAGSYEVEFDGSNYASGIYFYRLEVNGNHIETKRMILLK